MTEDFLQYVWQFALFTNRITTLSSGEKIEIISTGFRNTDAGPDFTNAKIKIDDIIWVGNVEIHINASDWSSHKHQHDKAYDNIILHVVFNNDVVIKRTSGDVIPTFVMRFSNTLYEKYFELCNSASSIACKKQLNTIDAFIINQWLHKLTIERLERKTSNIINDITNTNSNWDEVFYWYLARSFGFNVNAAPFEMLAKSIPLTYLQKHSDNLLQIESLLFGQAGFLNNNHKLFIDDKYYLQLNNEYKFLKHKFNLKPLSIHLWKFLRLRPLNFPTIRIAQFAACIHNSTKLFWQVVEANDCNELKKIFSYNTSPYWDTRYTFGKSSKKIIKTLGSDAVSSILINTVIPFIFVYGVMKDNFDYKDKALKFLEEIDPEKNAIITSWKKTSLNIPNAFYTQALLQLNNEYCKYRKCLHCDLGIRIITNRN